MSKVKMASLTWLIKLLALFFFNDGLDFPLTEQLRGSIFWKGALQRTHSLTWHCFKSLFLPKNIHGMRALELVWTYTMLVTTNSSLRSHWKLNTMISPFPPPPPPPPPPPQKKKKKKKKRKKKRQNPDIHGKTFHVQIHELGSEPNSVIVILTFASVVCLLPCQLKW